MKKFLIFLLFNMAIGSNVTYANNEKDTVKPRYIVLFPSKVALYLPRNANIKANEINAHSHYQIQYEILYKGLSISSYSSYSLMSFDNYDSEKAVNLEKLGEGAKIIKECNNDSCGFTIALKAKTKASGGIPTLISAQYIPEQNQIVDEFITLLFIATEDLKSDKLDEFISPTLQLNIQFTNRSSEISAKYNTSLAEFAKFLNTNDKLKVNIQAWSDKTEYDETDDNKNYTQELTSRRIEALKSILITEYNVNPDRFKKSESYGSTRPLAPSNTEEGREKNRSLYAYIY